MLIESQPTPLTQEQQADLVRLAALKNQRALLEQLAKKAQTSLKEKEKIVPTNSETDNTQSTIDSTEQTTNTDAPATTDLTPNTEPKHQHHIFEQDLPGFPDLSTISDTNQKPDLESPSAPITDTGHLFPISQPQVPLTTIKETDLDIPPKQTPENIDWEAVNRFLASQLDKTPDQNPEAVAEAEELAAKITADLEKEEQQTNQEIQDQGLTEKYLKFHKKIMSINALNFVEKIFKKEVKNKALRLTLGMINLSSILTAATVGAASMGGLGLASALTLSGLRRLLTASGATVTTYNLIGHIEKKVSFPELFTNQEEITQSTAQLKQTKQNLKDSAPKTGLKKIFQTPKNALGQAILNRKIKKLESNSEKNELLEELGLNQLLDTQCQRIAFLKVNGQDPDKDTTCQRLEKMIELRLAEKKAEDINYSIDWQREYGTSFYLNEEKKRQKIKLGLSAVVGAIFGSALLLHDHTHAALNINKPNVSSSLTPDQHHPSAPSPKLENSNLADLANQEPKLSVVKPDVVQKPPLAQTAPKFTPENITQNTITPITESKPTVSEWQPPKIGETQPLYLGQLTDATVEPGSGNGVIDALKYQLRANPEKFGYTGPKEKAWDWAREKANNLAANQGYSDILVKSNKPIAYVLQADGHILRVDPTTGKLINHADFNLYEYQKPTASSDKITSQPTNLEKPSTPNSQLPEQLNKDIPVSSPKPADLSNQPPVTAKPSIENTIQLTPDTPTPIKVKVVDSLVGQEKPSVINQVQPLTENAVSNFPESTPTTADIPAFKPSTPTTKIELQPLSTFAGLSTIEKNHLLNHNLTDLAFTPQEKIASLIKSKIPFENITPNNAKLVKKIFTDYAKDKLTTNPRFSANPPYLNELFGQYVLQKEVFQDVIANSSPDKALANTLDFYLHQATNPGIPLDFEYWRPAYNPQTKKLFNILKHGKIGGQIEYWLDTNGDGRPDKIFKTREQLNTFFKVNEPSLTDLSNNITNKESIITNTGKITSGTITGELAKNSVIQSREIAVDLVYKKTIPDATRFFEKIEKMLGADLAPENKKIFQRIYDQATAQNNIKPVDKIDWFAQQIQLEVQRILIEK